MTFDRPTRTSAAEHGVSLEDRLRSWTGPSSDTEQEKQARTERMVREAINAHHAFQGYQMAVYVKGSYPNNTNVRVESDVDIAVQCSDAFYWEEATPGLYTRGPSYAGIWTPAALRSEVTKALRATFPDQVDTNGRVAIKVNSSTARVDADIVPCFDYRYYKAPGSYWEGAKIFRKDNSAILNYPQQHLENGRRKNERTNHNFKKAVRILKRTANVMATSGVHREVASCLVESLVYNCPDSSFMASTWIDRIRSVIAQVWQYTQEDLEPASASRWREVSECKYLFDSSQSWNRKDARDFALQAWIYWGFAQQ